MRDDAPSARALRELVRDAQREPVPSGDWDAIERSLFERLAVEPSRATQRTRPPRFRWLATMAAAALVAAGVALVVKERAPEAPPSGVLESALPAGHIDGARLAVGSVVSAGDTEVTVEHVGHVAWTLEPHSMARLESVGDVIALALGQGAVRAHVVKSLRPESFVVRAEQTRVAVHGTVFRVARVGEHVHVDVSEGVVGVGPVGAPGFDLRAPGSAVMTLDGRRADQGDAVQAPRTADHPLPAKEHPRAAVLPQAPRDPEPDVDRVVAAVRACFANETVPRGDVRVSVLTNVSLRVHPDGTVSDVGFAPPLAPGVRTCVDAAVAKIRFGASTEGLSTARTIELER